MPKYFVGLSFVALVVGCSIHLDGAQYTPESLPRLVIDADSQQPVGGAYVIFNWWETRATLAGGQSHCVRAAFETTDRQGRFVIPAWRGVYPTVVDVYRRGMVNVGFKRGNEGVQLVRNSRTSAAERYREMLVTSGRLRCEDGAKSMVPVYQALLDEALAIRTPQTEQKLIDGFEIDRDAAMYGDEEAFRIHHQRVMARTRGDKK